MWFKKLRSNAFFQGSIVLTGANIVISLANYLFSIFSARALGPQGYGDIVSMFSYVILASIPLGFVTTVLIIKIGASSEHYVRAASLMHWFILKLKKWWIFVIPLLLVMPFLPWLTNISPFAAYSIIPILLFTSFIAIYDGVFQGLHLFVLMASFSVAFTVIKLLGAVLVLFTTPNIVTILFFIYLAYISKIAISHVFLNKKLKPFQDKIEPITKKISQLHNDKTLVLTLVTNSALAILSNVDIIYVKRMFTAEEAGIYSSWSLFAKIILYAIGPLLSISFVFFSSKKNAKYHQLFFMGSLLFLILVGIVSSVVYGLYSRELIDLFFGPKFYQVLPFIEWASLFGIAYVMILFMTNYFLAMNSKAAYILAIGIPLYIVGLVFYGTDLAHVMLVNIWFSFAVLAVFLLTFAKMRIDTLRTS